MTIEEKAQQAAKDWTTSGLDSILSAHRRRLSEIDAIEAEGKFPGSSDNRVKSREWSLSEIVYLELAREIRCGRQ